MITKSRNKFKSSPRSLGGVRKTRRHGEDEVRKNDPVLLANRRRTRQEAGTPVGMRIDVAQAARESRQQRIVAFGEAVRKRKVQ